MTDSYLPGPPNTVEPPAGTDDPSATDSGKVDTAKDEAGKLKDTAAEQAGHVAGTAKAEASNVAHEAKSQAKDLYHQTQSELKEQAAAQQQRVAGGLRALGDELSGMASSAETPGLASDLVRQVSDRASSAASWLDARDPGSLLNEVKSYARRKPGTFIAAAALAGLVAGRLTRALASSAADEKAAEAAHPSSSAPTTTSSTVPTTVPTTPAVTAPGVVGTPVPPATADETPLFTERASTLGDGYGRPLEGGSVDGSER